MLKKQLTAFTTSLLFPFLLNANDPYAGLEGGMQGTTKHQNAYLIHQQNNTAGWATRFFGGALWNNGVFPVRQGIEIGLNQYKTVTNTIHLPQNAQMIRSDLSRKALDVMAVVDYEFANKINIFAKGGIAYMKQRMQTRSETFVTDPIHAQTNNQELVQREDFDPVKRNRYIPKASVGFGYQVAPKQSMDFNYSYVFGKRKGPLFVTNKRYSDVLAVDSFMLAWNYHFS